MTFFFAIATIGNLLAQNQALSFKHLTINEGLSQNTIFSIFQDHAGFMWFGSEDGLNRYDGYEFKIFKNELNKPNSLQNNQVNVITEDKKGQLIIGTSGGLSFFNRELGDFVNVIIPKKERDLQSSNFVTSLLPDGNLLWVGTYDGLKLFDLAKRTFIPHHLPLQLGGTQVQTLFMDANRTLWIGYKNDLKCISLKSRRLISVPQTLSNALAKSSASIRIIKRDQSGNLWVGTEQSGLFYLSADQSVCTAYRHEPNNKNSLPMNVVRDIYFHHDGNVWIATRQGLSIFRPKTKRFTNYSNDKYDSGSLSHRSVLKILADRSGNIWIGTYAGGINLYSPSNLNFSTIGVQMGPKIGLSNVVVSSILHDEDGSLWVGTEGGGLNYLNRQQQRFAAYNLPDEEEASENIIKSLAKDYKGNIWVGAFDGLKYFNVATKTMSAYPLKKDPAYRGRSQVYSLLPHNDKLWIGTNGGGLIFLDPVNKKETVYTTDPKNKNSLIGNNVSTLAKDDNGNLWIGTLQGLCFFEPQLNRFTRFVHQAANKFSLTSNNITCLFIDSKSRFWIGTRGGGINLYDKSSQNFRGFTESDGLSNNVIRAINEDRLGMIWVSTNKGISVFDPQSLQPDKTKPQFKNYSITDGLQSNQFLSNASDRLPTGELLFGGINGISTFFPEKLTVNRSVSSVVFTDFLINNKSIDFSDPESPIKKNVNEYREVTLPYDKAYITIKFALLNFVNTSKNSYAYKLDGFGKDDWHYVNNLRSATYTNLNAGKYTFMVKAANGDGMWNTKVETITIHVLPPWYKSWLAFLIYALVIASLLYLFYYFSYKTAKLKNELDFEQFSHEKDQELAQRKLSFFTHISHEIKTPLTLIISPVEKLLNSVVDQKIRQQLQLIYRNGERLMRLTNQLLDYRKFETGNMKLQAAEGNMVRFVKEVMAAFQSYAAYKNLTFKLVTSHSSVRVWFDRDKMEKVMYNLISNAIKFTSHGGTVLIHISTENNNSEGSGKVLIAVEDNGVGILPENLASIFEQFQYYNTKGVNNEGTGLGLSFSKSLVEMHHGTIAASSNIVGEKKTVLTVTLPLGNAHLSENEMIKDYINSEDIRTYIDTADIDATGTLVAKKQEVLEASGADQLLMLIVEDNAEVLAFISSHFAENFRVVTATDGNEGWERAIETVPDMIISDVMMPNLTGTELCARLKKDERTSHIPIILLTARETLLYKLEGLETGADDYIVKPFNLSYLEARIWNLLENRNRLRERYSRDLTLQPTNITITSVDEKFLAKTLQYVEANIAEYDLSVETLSKHLGMSKATLYRKLKALTGLNTNEFIRTVRLNRAGQLLKQQHLNVSEVAYMVGFNDLDYFRKCFKEQFGVSPRAYATESS